MNIKTPSILLVAALGLTTMTGCVPSVNSKPSERFMETYQASDELSYANNVMHAAGMYRIRDAKIKGGKGSVSSGSLQTAAVSVGTAAELMSNPLGLGIDMANVLFWFAEPQKREAFNQIIAWVPEETNAGDAVEPLQKKITMAIKEYFEENPINPKVATKYSNVSKRQGIEDKVVGFDVYGGECNSEKGDRPRCFYGSHFKHGQYYAGDVEYFRGAVNAKPPSFANLNNATYILGHVAMSEMGRYTLKVLIPEVESLALWTYVSSKLPEYSYIYLAPKKYTFKNTEGVVEVGKAPLVLNQGKVNFFTVYEGE